MSQLKGACIIGQSGGPSAVINASAYGAIKTALENPDITQDVVDNGTVQAFIYVLYNVAENLGSWNPLPYAYPLEIKTNTGGEEKIEIAPEVTRMEYNVGRVTFVIQDLDGFDPEDITNSMSIKVCVTI